MTNVADAAATGRSPVESMPASTAPAVDVRVQSLRIEPLLPQRRVDHEHVRRLMMAPERWAPVVLSRRDLSVVDGYHRLLAARQLDRTIVAAHWFDGDPLDCLLTFLALNVRDGQALDRTERHEVVRRILSAHPDWADRRVGDLCGASPKTVAALRLENVGDAAAGDDRRSNVRVGRDGRARPTDPLAKRALIVELLQRDPDASLRTIAGRAGASPETVRMVKIGLLGPSDRRRHTPAVVNDTIQHERLDPFVLETHEPCVDRDAERAAFLERTDVGDADPHLHAESIPLSRAYEIADEARRRASFWARFADRIDGSPRRAAR